MKLTTFSSPSRGFSILKFLLGLVALLIVAVLAFLTFFLSPTAKWAANSQLPGLLGTDASVETLTINLWSGDVELGGVRIADPSGDPDKPPLFSLGRLMIDIDPMSVFSDTILIREVTVEAPEFNASRDEKGRLSLEDLKVMQPSAEEEPAGEEPEDDSDTKGPSKGIRIDKISVSKLAAAFADASDPAAHNEYSIKDFNFLATNLTVNPGEAVSHLPSGVEFALIQLSDAVLEYRTNKNIPGTDQSQDSSKKKKEDAAGTVADSEEASETTATATASTGAEKPTAGKTDPVYVEKFSLKNFRIHYLETSKEEGENPLDVTLTDFYLTAEDIAFDPDGLLAQTVDQVLTATMGFKIQQTGEGVSPANFTAVAKSTVIGSGLPVIAGSVQLTGFELETVRPVLPRGVQSAIGGPGFDLFGKWFVSPDKLEGDVQITSSANVVTNVTLGGTPDNITFEGGEMLMNVIGRPGQLLSNLAGNAFQGSFEIVSGATDAAGQLAKGAGETVAGFGKGLLNTGRGLLSGNLKEAGKGLEEATIGSVKKAGDTVGKTAESAAGGVGGAVDATTGGARQKDWRLSNEKRHQEFEAGAQQWLKEGKFPPEDVKTVKEIEKDATGGGMQGTTSPSAESISTGKSSESESDAKSSAQK